MDVMGLGLRALGWTAAVAVALVCATSGMAGLDPTPTCSGGSVGDRVWEDLDGDAVQDPGEPGINGVYVLLFRDDGDGVFEPDDDDDYLGYDTTEGDGIYTFWDIGGHSYWVDVHDESLPDGLACTTGNDPMLRAVGWDAHPRDVDFGYRALEGLECVTLQRPGAEHEIVYDACIRASSRYENYGGSTRLYVGEVYGGQRQTLIQFDMSAVPAGTVIERATLGLEVATDNGEFVRVHRILDPWAEGTVTWNSFDGAYDPAVEGYFFSGWAGTHTVDLTDLVRSWQAGTVQNHGILLEEDLCGYDKFRSSEYATVSMRPYLEVCYRGGCVIEDEGFIFEYLSAVENGDGTITLTFRVTNDNDCALSNVAIGIPEGVVPVWPIDGEVYDGDQNQYDVEFPSDDLFHAIKFETIGEGVKNAEADTFQVVLDADAAAYAVEIAAKACGIVGRGWFDEDCGPSVGTAGLGDFIWHDRFFDTGHEIDGIQDPYELANEGIEGVVVELVGVGGSVVATTSTDAAGAYSFTGLDAGSYTVRVADANFESGGLLQGWYASPRNRGGDDSRDSDGDATDHEVTVTLADGEYDDTIDFGFFYTCVDVCKSSVESTVAGTRITYHFRLENCGDLVLHGGAQVYDAMLNPYNDHLIWSGVVWPGEIYEFDMDYEVTVDECGMLMNTASAVGHPQHPDGYYLPNVYDESTWTVRVICDAIVGDYVWEDNDQDGCQTPGEPGVGGVTVELLDATHSVVGTTTTDDSGYYLFTGLDRGRYSVRFTLPPDTAWTEANCSSDELDSDVDPDTGETESFDIEWGDDDRTWDAGIVRPTLVALSSFEARLRDGDVMVAWSTAAETDAAGFYLDRLDDATGTWARVTPALVPAGAEPGVLYEVYDVHAAPGGVYLYRLVELTVTGGWNVYGPFEVAVGDPALVFDKWAREAFAGSQWANTAWTVADVDADGDGLSNYAEFVAGTDPADRASALRLTGITRRGDGTVRVQWAAVAGHAYTVEIAVDGVWRTFATDVAIGEADLPAGSLDGTVLVRVIAQP